MFLSRASEVHLVEIGQWFSSREELYQWSGPKFRYPFTRQTFTEDLNMDDLASFVLFATDPRLHENSIEFDKSKPLAFGQYYRRLDRCHLGRLVVNPAHRGKGVVNVLVSLLSARGCEELGVQECSLFVLEDNVSAIKAYQKIGFQFSSYSGDMGMDDCLYMVKSSSK